MVSLLHVPLFDSDGSSSHSFFVLLSDTSIDPFFSTAKALEGQATLKSTGGAFYNKWWHNSFILHHVGKRTQIMWTSQVGGLIAMLASFYLLAQGWAMATYSPFSLKDSPDAEVQTEQVLGMTEMVVPIFAGVLSALRRVIARRVSLKNQLKRRLHAITIASATCFLFPVAMWDMIIGSPSGSSVELPFSTWAFLSTILFGVILISYVDSIAEERLHMVFSSPRHLMVAGGCIIVLEVVYKMDFSLPGFLICCLILGFGIYEATSLERTRKDSVQNSNPSNGVFDDEIQMSPLPT
ncbi:uncharacterized protein LOC133859265 isoform X3 [Alnus glutinosa]|uniref:uncharacterized protein LOC133859265 isoform X3 n=1 Tax=Alnus glutinosa TaxID=3517 RepID=UPI002D797DD0|nr:uncharacterized protein LOC133859265 isoform X3 [Alnus glutinosa]